MPYTPKIIGQLKLQFIEDMRTKTKTLEQCPRCSSTHYKRNGYTKKGSTRYRCLGCGKSFIIRSDMANDATRKSPETWDMFVDCMIDCCSHRYAAYICNISPNTSMAWRYLLFDALEKLYVQNQIEIDDQIESEDPDDNPTNYNDLNYGSDQYPLSDGEIGDQLMIADCPTPINDGTLRVNVDRWNKVYIKNVGKYRLWQKFVKQAMESGYEKKYITNRVLKK